MRWYQNPFPNVGESVMVRCERITDIGTYCKLLEYGDLEALVPITEVTKQRVRLVSHIIPVGRVFVAIVLSVDAEKGYIDLSKKRVNEEDILNCETRYFKSRKLHSVLVQLESGGVGGGLSNLYERVWNLSSTLNEVAGKVPQHPVDHLETFLNSLAEEPTSKDTVSKIREKYLASKISEIQAEVEMTCFSPEGIEGIKKSIREGLLVDPGVKIRILSAPLYLIQFSTREPEQGIRVVEKVIDILGRTLRTVDGELCIKKPPSTTDKENREQLQYRLAVFERQQEQLDGDEDSE
jgi:translation initiation factor 2 subunit 1